MEKTERVTMYVVILLNQACLEPLAAQQNRLIYGLQPVQLRIYVTDKLAADSGELEYEEATQTHIAYLILQFSEGDLTTVRLELNEHTHHTIASFYLAHDYDGPLPNTITEQLIHVRRFSKIMEENQ